jgi:uncharacterized phage protein (TIGR01671 family)
MREIKFRAWDKELKKMVHIVSLEYGVDCKLLKASCAYQLTEMEVYGNDSDEPSDVEILYRGIEFLILMQFTGLHDSKGNEIYEGDVLRFNGEYPMNLDSWMGRRFWEKTGYVYYDDKESRFTCTEMGNQVSTSYWIACSKEVIGNIYENPSLLKEA